MNNNLSLQELIQAISIKKKRFKMADMNIKLIAGLYCRLSRDDEDFTLESSSISTQKIKLKKYAVEHEIEVYDYFIDDGISGTTFNRPAFMKMLECIETRKINCVIVKDASRLGRDTTICNMLIERLILNGIRYIAIDNSVDIDILSYAFTDNMQLQITNLFNEFYAADISRKVRSALHTKAENGQYLTKAPYGYTRSSTEKNKLVIEPAQAEVIRLIFKMYLDGNSISYIVKFLRKNKIPTASDILYSKSEYNWGIGCIKNFLSNDVYIGRTTYAKTRKISYKSDIFLINPKTDWINIDQTHEAIISLEDFQKVAEKLQQNRLIIRSVKNPHPSGRSNKTV